MEPVGSIPNSQELSTCSYPEPDQSSPHHPMNSRESGSNKACTPKLRKFILPLINHGRSTHEKYSEIPESALPSQE
jgi:hypothetical protein